MAVTFTIYDPETKNTKTIHGEIDASVIAVDGNDAGTIDYYVRLSTSARKVNGDAISDQIIRGLSYMAHGGLGGTKHAGGSGPYTTLDEAIQDYVLHMVEGEDANTAMAF